jgi:hypothetical protein
MAADTRSTSDPADIIRARMMRFFRLLRPSRPMTALALSIAVVMLALTISGRRAVVAQAATRPASANAHQRGRYDELRR